jgi:hypothetical protein
MLACPKSSNSFRMSADSIDIIDVIDGSSDVDRSTSAKRPP